MRFALLLAATLAVVPASAAENNQLDGNRTLFSVMAALHAAEFHPATQTLSPLQSEVRKLIVSKNLQVVSELRNFIASHRKPGSADLAQYVSFALASNEPPEFKSRFRTNEIPPDVAELEGFQALMIRFHRDAGIDELWARAQPAFEQVIGWYHEPVSRAVLEVNGYLRNPTSGYMGRRFQIYVDPVGPGNQVHTRSYGDDYFVVVTPAAEPQTEDIRHAYLHYLLDPLFFKFSEQVNKHRGLVDYAQAAPALDASYKSDYLLLATESLIKAIESRLARGAATRQAMVDQALAEGYVITPAFAELLPAYEKQEAAMRLHFPDMFAGIDLKKEERRLDKVQFAAAKAERKPISTPKPAEPQMTGAEKTLEDAEQQYADRDLEKAHATYMRVLKQTDNRPVHARAYYGLARIATLRNDPELAERLFHKTLELSPDPQTQAWAELYLGRLSDVAGQREEAAKHYQAVLKIEGASEAARQAAEKGLKNSFQRDK
jgi:tetratricopeptide (TPR) repeat protein